MKNKQHSLSVLLAALCALCVLFSLFPAAVFADGTEDDEAAAEERSADAGGQLVIGASPRPRNSRLSREAAAAASGRSG